MQQPVTGQVVRSRAGRDVGKCYMVAGLASERVLLADGDKWPLAAPKKKNPRHIQPTKHMLEEENRHSDVKLKTALRAYEAAREPQEQGG